MQRIGRYEILLELGRGAMGAVYQARDPQIDRIVAVKVILTHGLSEQELESYKQRFYREARAAGKMSHPGIVTIHDIAEDEAGHPYLVMEFVEGSTLQDIVEGHIGREEQMPLERALDIAIQVSNALDYAHRRGVVHRDVKPANVLVTPEGVAKIADFGIAKISGVTLTQTGSFLGTPAFMSPEQFSGGTIEARSDLFSLGAMLYWMFTGQQPFGGETLTQVSFRIVFTYPTPAHQVNPKLPPELNTVLLRCLAKNPDERFATCRELAEDLEAIKLGRPIKAVPLPLQEATIANAPAVVDAGLGSTIALPLEASPAATVAAPPVVSPTAQTTRIERTPFRAARKPRRGLFAFVRARPILWATLALLLLALGAGGKWWWPLLNSAAGRPEATQTAEPPRDEQTAAATPTPAPAPPLEEPKEETAPPEPAPAVETSPPASRNPGKGIGRGRNKRAARPAVPTGTLVIDCQHNFRDGTLEILIDDDPLLTLALRGDVRDLGVISVASGTVRRTIAIPTGQHVFTVRVRANRGDYRGEEQIGGRFSEGATRILLIEFGKGSGLKVFDRKLTLSWR